MSLLRTEQAMQIQRNLTLESLETRFKKTLERGSPKTP